MTVHIITIFPEVFIPFFEASIIGRAKKKKLINIHIYNLRDFTTDNHKTVDKRPFGGGAGMIMTVEPIYKCLESIKLDYSLDSNLGNYKVILTSASGKKFTQSVAMDYSKLEHLILICGHYEGVDDRIKHLIDEEISIGDYVLSGGESAVMVITDAVTRIIPEVLGNSESLKDESHNVTGIGEYPQFTRPEILKLPLKSIRKDGLSNLESINNINSSNFNNADFVELKVPEVLLSGNHQKIEKWRDENRKNLGEATRLS